MKLFLRSITVILFIVFSGIIYAQSYIQQGDKLVGEGVFGPVFQGRSVAISADGNTAIVGGYGDHHYQGAAWIFIKQNGQWMQQGEKLVGTGAIEDALQGYSVAISADGNTAVLGGANDNDRKGAAWIFIRKDGVWTQQGEKLVGTNDDGGRAAQGRSVAISGDGNTVVVGGPDDWNHSCSGAVWVFTRENGIWKQYGDKLVGKSTSGAYIQQGISVAISTDGSTIIIGGIHDNTFDSCVRGKGSAWIFTKVNGVWTQQGEKLVGSNAVGTSEQGSSVALSADGNTAVIGGAKDNDGIGAAWVFVRYNGIWTQSGSKLVGTGANTKSEQGTSVSVSGDGKTVIISGKDGSTGKAAAWIFVESSSEWTQHGDKIVVADAIPNIYYEGAVSISSDGRTAILGSCGDSDTQGGVWILDGNNGMWRQLGSKLLGSGATVVAGQGKVAISADGNTAVIGGADDNDYQGALWIFARENGIWSQQGEKLTARDWSGRIVELGFAVSISADGNTVIAGGLADNSYRGAAWIFTKLNGKWVQQCDKLVGSGAVGLATQGYSVAISGDGNTAIVGGYSDNEETGAAWIFVRKGTQWVQQGEKLVGSGTNKIRSYQAHSVAISADGNTAVIGGPGDFIGAAWVFVRNNGVWSQQGEKLVATYTVGFSPLGKSVAISADGNTIVMDGSYDHAGQGSLWVFTRKNGAWSQYGNKIIVTTGYEINYGLGEKVAISADGNTIIMGCISGNGQGSAWIFKKENGTWNQQGGKLFGSGSVDRPRQGESVDISADGSTAIIGGTRDDFGRGAAWIFIRKTESTLGSISGKVTSEGKGLQNVKLYLWDRSGLPFKNFTSPAVTDASGCYCFTNVPFDDTLQVYLMEPLGYVADINPRTLFFNANNTDITHADFKLRKSLKENNAQSCEYWADQFRYYVEDKKDAPAEESLDQLLRYIKEVHEHYAPYFGLFRDLATVEDWYSVFYYASRFRNYDFTSKAELAALLLNIVSLKLPQYYVTTMDKRTAGECLSFISELAMMDDRANNVSIYYMSYKLNMRQILTGGIVPESSVLYKFNGPENHNEISSQIPDQYKLYSNFPNPFNPSTNIEFDIAGQSYVSLIIYDINGREIERLADRMMQPGHYRLQWNAAKYPSGMYLCRMNAGEYTDIKKLMLVK